MRKVEKMVPAYDYIAEDGTIGIKEISIDKVVQSPDQDLILDGGGAAN